MRAIQRSIEILIMKSKSKNLNNNSIGSLYVSENKYYDMNSLNKVSNNTKEIKDKNDKKLNNNQTNFIFNPINIHSFDNLITNEEPQILNQPDIINNTNNKKNTNNTNSRKSTYKKKIKINQNQNHNKTKTEEIIGDNNNKLDKKPEIIVKTIKTNEEVNSRNICHEVKNDIINEEKRSMTEIKTIEENNEKTEKK